jgi:hypothetical protein
MAKSFAITTTATEALRADSKGHAQVVFTVTNTNTRPLRGLAKPKPLGDTKREWLNLEGEAERDFAAGATHQFTVNFDGPITEPAGAKPAPTPATTATSSPASGTPAPARKCSFRLDVESAQNPDEDFTEGPVVTVELPAAPIVTGGKKFPLWIIFLIIGVLVLIGIIVLVIVLVSGGKKPPPGEPTPSPTPTASATVTPKPAGTKYEGRWVNADPNTRGITRIEIDQRGSQLSVHAFGKCHPTDCDWGIEKGAVVGNQGQVTWDQGFAIVKMVLTLEGEQLKAVTDTVFNDSRPRLHEEYLFNKQQ